MTRVAPDQTMVYKNQADGKEWNIRPGTPVSMTALTVQMNPKIFPDPKKFEPERWLENPRLDKYLLAFSKGSRICLGYVFLITSDCFRYLLMASRFHLAYSELYLFLAAIFRKYDLYDGTNKQTGPTLALYDTVRERDIDPVVDLVVPYPAKGSHGLRLTVRGGNARL